jgi:hypothetical protein
MSYPFDEWGFISQILKRQRELGEYDPDFPSTYGPVTEYHGTTFLPEQFVGQPVTYTTTDYDKARQWAEQQAKRFKVKDPRRVGVVGVRGSGLQPATSADPRSGFQTGEVRVHSPEIPRRRLVMIQ